MENKNRFEDILYALPTRIAKVLYNLPLCVKQNACEIRLRANLPLALTVNGDTVFLRENGQTQFFISKDLIFSTTEDLEEAFKKLCNNSVYAHEDELKYGYVALKNGCRAGICGNLTNEGYMQDISSINIRIAHEVFGAANDIIKSYCSGGLLIVGPPCSGKTTVLRDLIRQLSNGATGKIQKICVIDSRNEISGSSDGKAVNDLGVATDVLLCQNKAAGIEIALRTLFPDIIAFDEIGNINELESVSESFNSGVDIITTAHAGSIEELLSRKVTASLLKSGAISQIAILPEIHGGEIKLYKQSEILENVTV